MGDRKDLRTYRSLSSQAVNPDDQRLWNRSEPSEAEMYCSRNREWSPYTVSKSIRSHSWRTCTVCWPASQIPHWWNRPTIYISALQRLAHWRSSGEKVRTPPSCIMVKNLSTVSWNAVARISPDSSSSVIEKSFPSPRALLYVLIGIFPVTRARIFHLKT